MQKPLGIQKCDGRTHSAANLLFCAHLGLFRPKYDHRQYDFKVVYKQTYIPGASFNQIQLKKGVFYLLVGLVRSEIVQKNTQKIEKFCKIFDAVFFYMKKIGKSHNFFFEAK